jgi:hypothetical protein
VPLFANKEPLLASKRRRIDADHSGKTGHGDQQILMHHLIAVNDRIFSYVTQTNAVSGNEVNPNRAVLGQTIFELLGGREAAQQGAEVDGRCVFLPLSSIARESGFPDRSRPADP